MRIARFVAGAGHVLTGVLTNDGLGAEGRPRTARPLVGGDVFAAPRWADATVDVVKLLPPVEPPNIFAIGRNYAEHVRETAAKRPTQPLIFMKATTALAAPGAPILLPANAPHQVDYEAELALIIGRTAQRVSVADALSYVWGYTCANDVSARDCQAGDGQWSRAKGFDSFCPLGPWVVTADTLDPHDLRVRSRLNGRTMQDARTSAMIFGPAELVSYLSHQFTLLPGTVILTGTPEGVGFVRKPPVFLADGDTVDVEVEGIGVLSNPVCRGL
jgi:2-keto-4-pentenoate hydratase/2-oxohepta-3-ene-1,7-dioic acid hydratase in catechol pathway